MGRGRSREAARPAGELAFGTARPGRGQLGRHPARPTPLIRNGRTVFRAAGEHNMIKLTEIGAGGRE
jgi:hypothetical protein